MRRTPLIAFAALALTAAACGSTSDQAATTTAPTQGATAPTAATGGARVFTSADGVEVEIEDTSRIVSLTGDLTEIAFELGLGDQVVAIDVTTTFPQEATDLPVIGFAQQLAAEPVLAFTPTLVIGDMTIAPPEAIQQIRDAGVPVMLFANPTTLDGIADKIIKVAEVLGVPEEGAALAASVQSEIDAAVALAAGAETQPTIAYIYVRGPQTILLFGQGMPTQVMIEAANALDAGVSAEVFGAVPLTPEALIAAAPDLIVLPEAGLAALGGIEALIAIPGIADTPAGQNGAFLSYDEAYFFNFGPRVGQALAQFVADIHPELAGG